VEYGLVNILIQNLFER